MFFKPGVYFVQRFRSRAITLAADTRKGTRASFTRAAAPDVGREYFELLLQRCRDQLPRTASGKFGADMQVALVNDGPVTFWLET